jgi:adenine deaminase
MFDDYKMSENVYKVTLVNPVTDDKLYVLWTDNFTQKTEIKMESNNYKVIDIYGEEITPEVVDSHLVIALSATPVYVLFSK